jgi:hypothetical protein
MLVDYDSLVNELSSVLSKCRLTPHRARVKALSSLLQEGRSVGSHIPNLELLPILPCVWN